MRIDINKYTIYVYIMYKINGMNKENVLKQNTLIFGTFDLRGVVSC